MKKLSYILLIFCLFSMTSCIDVVEELFLKKNGSGKYVITMDMSAMMKEGMKEMLEGMVDEMDEEKPEEEEGVEKEGVEEETKPKRQMEMDSIMYFSDAPDSIRNKFAHPEILDKVYVRIQTSEIKELMKITFAIDFDNMKEVDYFLDDIQNMQSDSPLPGGMAGGGGLLPTAGSRSLFSLAKRKLTRKPAESTPEAMGEEEMQMMKMFMASASYKTIYHLPGKVKKTTMKNAKIDGKDLIIETSLMDILEGKSNLEGDICYKRR